MAAKEKQFTPEQKEIITSRGRSVLVSASAGSGKTTTMIERIAGIIAGGVPVTEILALTFTKAAAAEMREKLLGRLAENSADPFIREQLSLFPLCSVDTIHGFCADLLRSNFAVLGLDPAFSVIEKDSADALFEEALEDVLNDYYAENSAEFYFLTDAFGRGRRDTGLRKIIKELYECAVNTSEPEKWLDSLHEYYTEKHLEKILSRLNTRYTREAEFYLGQIAVLLKLCRTAQMTAHIEALEEVREQLEQIRKDKSFAQNYAAVTDFCAKRLPSKKKTDDGILTERIKSVKKNLTEKMAKFQKEFGGKPPGRLLFECAECAPKVRLLGEMTLRVRESYAAKKRKLAALDFSDLEQLSYKLLGGAAEEIRALYKYVFVDEYQDINELQEGILKRLSGADNRFMVGDAKQCIYAFRHSNPEIIKGRMEEFSDGVKGLRKRLRRNYRSHGGILDFVNFIFENVMTPAFGGADYNEERLECGREGRGDDCRVSLTIITGCKKSEREYFDEDYSMPYDINAPLPDGETENAEAEAIVIAGRIKELVEKGMDYGDIVILSRSQTKRAYAIYQKLSALGVPVSFPAEKIPDANAEIKTLINFLSVINNPLQDIPLAAALTGFLYNISPDELAAARLMKTDNPDTDFFGRLCAYAETPEGGRVRDFLNDLRRYRAMSMTLNAAELLTVIINEKSVEKYALARRGGGARAAAVWNYLSVLGNGQGTADLGSFCAFGARDEKVGGTDAGNVVRMLSVHAAKGLEYPAVILAGLDVEEVREAGEVLTDKDFGAAMDYYDAETRIKSCTLNKAVVKELLDTRRREEMLRILYVALTRAKEYLYITGCTNKLPEPDPSALDQHEIACSNNLLDIITAVVTNRGAQCFELTAVDKSMLSAQREEALRRTTFPLADKKRIKQIENALDYRYPFEAAKTSEYKMAASLAAKLIYPPDLAAKRTASKGRAAREDAADTGTLYHKVLCYIDFGESAESGIARLCREGVITESEAATLDAALIQKILGSDLMLRAAAAPHFKEQPFMTLIPARETDANQAEGDDVIIQGIIDLMFFEEGGIVIADYKLSDLPAERLRSVYAGQLKIYARAAETVLGKPVREKYILNIKTGEIIKI